MTLYKPGDVAEFIESSTDTVRRYSARFARFLSESAHPGKGKARLYNSEDVYLLQAVKRLTEQGLTYDDIERELENLSIPESFKMIESPPDLPPPLVVLQQIANALETLIQQNKRIDGLEKQVAHLQSEITKMQRAE